MKLAVNNFGPIVEGEVALRPLTVFIGKNNTGKSYAATLMYAVVGTFFGFLAGLEGRSTHRIPISCAVGRRKSPNA